MYYMYYTFGFVILMSDTERLTFLDIYQFYKIHKNHTPTKNMAWSL